MGMQNALHRVVGGADVGKGFITGALFDLGQSIARLFHHEGSFRRAASNMLSWIVFVGGAVIGAFALGILGLANCLVVAVAVVLAMIAALFAEALTRQRAI